MGIEYRLRFAASEPLAVAEILQRHPDAHNASSIVKGFKYGLTADGWPQATARIEVGGVYFCDHCGGQGRVIIDELVLRLASAFGPVTIEEL